jgi:chemotaxis protein CheZ
MSGDSPDLEALFDSIAFAQPPEPEKAETRPGQEGDTPELENLFDSIAQAVSQGEGGGAGEGVCPERVFSQLGQMTRGLHNLLRELGYDKTLEKVASALPDNRDRLNYIAAMTAQAAERALNAAETAQPIQERMGAPRGISPANGTSCSTSSWVWRSSRIWCATPGPTSSMCRPAPRPPTPS